MTRSSTMSFPGPNISQLYQTLSEEKRQIRLVSIEPQVHSSETMECRMETFALADTPPYKALSYVWGDVKVRVPITLNGIRIQVTTNLLTAMRRLCQLPSGTYFWIDALCIDQGSTEEKNQQLPLMRNIYEQAEEVLMWLGERKHDSHLAISLIDRWGNAMLLRLNGALQLDTRGEMAATLALIDDPFDQSSWSSLKDFFLTRPYWRRIWIVQEVVLSRNAKLLCGESEVGWDSFVAAMGLWTELTSSDFDGLVSYENQITIENCGYNIATSLTWLALRKGQTDDVTSFSFTLLNLLRETRTHLAWDPRDKIYGVLGLVDVKDVTVKPDYNRTVVQVYTDFVVAHVRATKRLTSICFDGVGVPKTRIIPRLPSWVPDISNTENAMRYFSESNYSAADDIEMQSDFSKDFKELLARGIVADEVTEVENSDPLDDTATRRLRRWQDLAASQNQKFHPTGIPWRQAFYRTLVADRSGYGYGRPDFRDEEAEESFFDKAAGFMLLIGSIFGQITEPTSTESGENDQVIRSANPEKLLQILLDESLNDFVKAFTLWTAELPDSSHAPSKDALLESFCGPMESPSSLKYPHTDDIKKGAKCKSVFYFEFVGVTNQRSFFLTKRGYIGLGPLGIRKGDLVCVLLGCNVPLITRRVAEHCLLVGDSYIYGMMNGEVIQEVRNQRLQYEDFIFE